MFFVVGFGVAADSRFVRRSSRKSDRCIYSLFTQWPHLVETPGDHGAEF
jgi:hypothetical protein